MFRVAIIVAAGVLLCSFLSQASSLMLSLGAGHAVMLWQTQPPAFAPEATWADVGLYFVFSQLSIGVYVGLPDLLSRLFPPRFSPYCRLTLGHLGWSTRATLFGEAGAVVNPRIGWVAWYLGGGGSFRPLPVVEGRVLVFVETTRGVPGLAHAGWIIGVWTGATVYLPLF